MSDKFKGFKEKAAGAVLSGGILAAIAINRIKNDPKVQEAGEFIKTEFSKLTTVYGESGKGESKAAPQTKESVREDDILSGAVDLHERMQELEATRKPTPVINTVHDYLEQHIRDMDLEDIKVFMKERLNMEVDSNGVEAIIAYVVRSCRSYQQPVSSKPKYTVGDFLRDCSTNGGVELHKLYEFMYDQSSKHGTPLGVTPLQAEYISNGQFDSDEIESIIEQRGFDKYEMI